MSESIQRPLRLTRRGEIALAIAQFVGLVLLIAMMMAYFVMVLFVLAKWFGVI